MSQMKSEKYQVYILCNRSYQLENHNLANISVFYYFIYETCYKTSTWHSVRWCVIIGPSMCLYIRLFLLFIDMQCRVAGCVG